MSAKPTPLFLVSRPRQDDNSLLDLPSADDFAGNVHGVPRLPARGAEADPVQRPVWKREQDARGLAYTLALTAWSLGLLLGLWLGGAL